MEKQRDLTDDFKLSVRSIAEVFEQLAGLVARAAGDRTIRFQRPKGPKKATRAAVINALICHVAALPQAEQRRMIADGMKRLNALLAGDELPGSPLPTSIDALPRSDVSSDRDSDEPRSRRKGRTG